MDSTNVDNDTIAFLKDYPKLEILGFSFCKNVSKLPELRTIKELYLAGTEITDEVVASLALSSDLVILDIEKCKKIAKIPVNLFQLRRLSMQGTSVHTTEDRSTELYARLPNLKRLDFFWI